MSNQEIKIKIINELIDGKWFDNEIKKVVFQRDLREDFKQEILLIILQYQPVGKLYEAYRDGKHLNFIKQIMLNQYYSNTSSFYRKFIRFRENTEIIPEKQYDLND